MFIDFDNVEIGVKNTIGGQFDIGLVLEAIKERGEIVTKIAYSDWKRAGDYSRLLTQHAIRMVQRNVTPGGDKNGADITMALDALEMAFTHDHINAFVIVGGDSDFISLVEKLKQYGRKVIVVGGRQFTSSTMQQNCHEFIAYENLVGTRGRDRPAAARSRRRRPARSPRSLPLIQRALKVLADREATPQLGLLKSTLLQLDSTFSEREYGAGSFRDFMEKVAAVRCRDAARGRTQHAGRGEDRRAADRIAEAPAADDRRAPAAAAAEPESGDEETLPASPMTMQDGIRAVQTAFGGPTPPRWPMYVRQAKQFLRTPSRASTRRTTGSRRSSICCAPRARRACCGSSAIVRAPFACSPVRSSRRFAPSSRLKREPVAELPIVDAEPVGGSRRSSRRGASTATGRGDARRSRRAGGRAAKPKGGRRRAEAEAAGHARAQDRAHQGRSRRPQ